MDTYLDIYACTFTWMYMKKEIYICVYASAAPTTACRRKYVFKTYMYVNKYVDINVSTLAWIYIEIYVDMHLQCGCTSKIEQTCMSLHVCITWKTYKKRDVHMKRDLHIWKETYKCELISVDVWQDVYVNTCVCYMGNISKETYERRPAYTKRDLYIWKETYTYEQIRVDVWQDVDVTTSVLYMIIIQKRLTHMKRDLQIWKRDLYMWAHQSRRLTRHVCQYMCVCGLHGKHIKRDLNVWKETCKYERRTMHITESYTYGCLDKCVPVHVYTLSST